MTGLDLLRRDEPTLSVFLPGLLGREDILKPDEEVDSTIRADLLATVDELSTWARILFILTAIALPVALVEAIAGRPILRGVLITCGVLVFLSPLSVFLLSDMSSHSDDLQFDYHSGFLLATALSGSALVTQVWMAGLRGRGLAGTIVMLGAGCMGWIMVLIGIMSFIAD
jgi:hypothetical protein